MKKILMRCLLGAAFVAQSAVAADPIKIGVISSDSGPFASFGLSGEYAAILASEEINAKGGVLGRPLELLTADDKSKPEESSRLFREQVAAGAFVVLGNVGSNSTVAITTLAKEQKIPFFTTLGYGRFLTEEAGHRYFFRLNVNSRGFYEPLAAKLAREKYKSYCTISNDFVFGREVTESLMASLKKAKPDVHILPGCEFWVPLGTTEFSSYIAAILAKKPDALMFGGLLGPSGRSFIAQSKRFGLFEKMGGAHPAAGWSGNTAGLRADDIPANISTASTFPYPIVDRPENKAFVAAYKKRWKNELPTDEGVSAYVTIKLIAKAIEKAGKLDREAFVNAAEEMTIDHPAAGPITVRPFDHQADMGVWTGTLAWDKVDNRVGITNIKYIPGNTYLPSEAEIRVLRQKAATK